MAVGLGTPRRRERFPRAPRSASRWPRRGRLSAIARSTERIFLLNRVGVGGLTTGAIAHLAELSQPAFYLYFRSIDEVLAAAAERVSAHVRTITRSARLAASGLSSRDPIRESYATAVKTWLEEPGFITLFVRHRRDRSTTLGRKLSRLQAEMIDELVADLLAMGVGETIPDLEL